MNWLFDQGPNVATLTTKQVIHKKLPILNVSHYSDDDSWAFTCGTTDNSNDLMLVSMQEVIDTDFTLHSIADLAPGWNAYRESVQHKWIREQDS